ncbi:acyl-CoA dehydrogenase family protein [Streptomyces sp. NPDC058683]|uniref:acyl-CoA dehydrogenase family protein n=1 Tax=Streptomyces sp. NPDC058683 TaxID=3346597 RepID=UPI0036556917
MSYQSVSEPPLSEPTSSGRGGAEAAPTPAELVARAEELVPVLAERAARTEEQRRVPDETVRDLVDAGLIRIATPQTYGGHGVDIDTLFEVGWRLAQGCGATGWFYSVTQSHNWLMGTASKEVQDEYFASPDVISSSAFAPTGKTEQVRDGWQISGRWPFSSGVDHAEWVWLGAMDIPRKRQAYLLVPRSEIKIVDDWYPAGLRGTGSKSVVIEESVFVPEYRVFYPGPAHPEARDRHGRASYAMPQSQVMPIWLSTPLVGMAQGAIKEFARRTPERRLPGGRSHADLPGPQLRLAESAAEADAAMALLRTDLRDLIEFGAAGKQLTDEERARFRRNHCYTAKLAVSAVNRLYDASGANAILDPSPISRIHRDVNAGSHQIAVAWDNIAELYGRVLLGVEPNMAMW